MFMTTVIKRLSLNNDILNANEIYNIITCQCLYHDNLTKLS